MESQWLLIHDGGILYSKTSELLSSISPLLFDQENDKAGSVVNKILGDTFMAGIWRNNKAYYFP